MKKSLKTFLILMLTVATVFSASIPAWAAVSPASTTAYAGQEIQLKYHYSGIAGITGTFQYSNPGVFSNVKFQIDGLSMGQYNAASNSFAYFGSAAVNCTITLTLTVSSSAKPGDSCSVSMQYETAGADGNMPSVPNYKYDNATIRVVEKLDFSTLNTLIGQAEGLNKSSYTSDSWSKLETFLNHARAVRNSATTQNEINAAAQSLRDAINSLVKLPDYSDLDKQIKIAESLKKEEYTAKSWDVLASALKSAKTARNSLNQTEVTSAANSLKKAIASLVSIYEGKLNFNELNRLITIAEGLSENEYDLKSWAVLAQSLDKAKAARSLKDQGKIDKAASDLKSAIDGLVKFDNQRLAAAIQAIEEYFKDNKFLALWAEYQSLLTEANNALTSRDQELIDSYAQKLEEMFNQLKQSIADLAGIDSVVIEKPVEVAPKNDFCNIKSHIGWMIFFWVSFAINLALAALIIMYYYTKKKKVRDDTPLVDYNIFDDGE